MAQINSAVKACRKCWKYNGRNVCLLLLLLWLIFFVCLNLLCNMSIYKLCTSPPADKWLSDACMGLVLVLLDLITVCDTNLCVSYAEWQKIKKKNLLKLWLFYPKTSRFCIIFIILSFSSFCLEYLKALFSLPFHSSHTLMLPYV